MNTELDRIEFARDEDMRVRLYGDALPYRFGIAQVRSLPGDKIVITIDKDSITERETRDDQVPFWQFIWRLLGGR